jgi:hypothetical protein
MRNHQRSAHFPSNPRASNACCAGATTTLLLAALGTTAPREGLAQQQLVMTAEVGKTEFFEDEPIYLLVRLQNVGTDTAWTYFFDILSPAVSLSVIRGQGKPVEVAKPIVDYAVRPSWRGEPVPPGASFLKTIILQDIMGDKQDISSKLFAHHLVPEQYQLQVVFHPQVGVPRTKLRTIEAAPIAFRIRERTAAQENEVGELEQMRRMGQDTTRVAGYPRAAGYKAVLIDWVERRVRTQPDDPFLPFLLSNGLYGVGEVLWRHVLSGEVQRFDPDTSDVVSRLRLTVIERHRFSTGGVHLVAGLTARHPDQLAVLAERLSGTPVGEMARYHVERNEHAKQFKKQPPR